MAPFRTSARTNRSGRVQQDEELAYLGFPVKQWRQTEGTFGLPPPKPAPVDKDLVFPEPPMPRDAPMLEPFTQQILREARKPRFAKRKFEATEEPKPEEDQESKDRQAKVGWAAKKWTQMEADADEIPYLAPRRKGLPTNYTEAPAFVPQVATRTAKVRKVDVAGNATVYEVIVPEGQTVEGEVKDEDVSMADAPTLAPGTVVEGIGVANAEGQVVAHDLLQPTPARRRKPPPPKRKGGPGRGKKKVMFQPAPANGTPAPAAAGVAVAEATSGNDTPSSVPAGSEHGEANAEGEDEEGEEGEEGEDGDEDGEDREGGEPSGDDTPAARGQDQITPAVASAAEAVAPVDETMAETTPAQLPPSIEEPLGVSDVEAASQAPKAPSVDGLVEPVPTPTAAGQDHLSIPPPPPRSASSSPDLPLAKTSHSRQNSSSELRAGQPPMADIPGLGTLPSAADAPSIPAPVPIPAVSEQPALTEKLATAAVTSEPTPTEQVAVEAPSAIIQEDGPVDDSGALASGAASTNGSAAAIPGLSSIAPPEAVEGSVATEAVSEVVPETAKTATTEPSTES
ncbi:Zinc finger CCCH domain-containing protein 45 [Sphaceloma murrayae]|uniref:Zinc finger CCCH domain-containing protein 45 n=1 Tax=Sphaceloma murrayae TaxID=2082308 RepID=A0A2K1QLX7_9PEZI|nr:Zinc finger CCCH domain-containing protein 45 [Sphaceloma murrayae]